VSRINDLRASQGLGALEVSPALAGTSCQWNDVMIANGGISHDPGLAGALDTVTTSWKKGGENVGMGGDVDALFRAFVNSPSHYRNLVEPSFNRIGVCVTYSDAGVLFTTHRFMALPPPPPPPPAPGVSVAPAPAPVVTAAPAPAAAPIPVAAPAGPSGTAASGPPSTTLIPAPEAPLTPIPVARPLPPAGLLKLRMH